MTGEHDYIVVGSGPSGAMAAQTLVEAGTDVAMLDVGFSDSFYQNKIPDQNFVSLRKEDTEQHVYFLGEQFEGIPLGKIKTGPQLTPPRKFVIEGVEKWLPTISNSFEPMQSLAYGGLGSAWGLACFAFSGPELREMGLDETKMIRAYQTIADRIGISGERDDGLSYCTRELNNIQPPTKLDSSAKRIYSNYKKNAPSLNKKGIFLGRTALALLTKNLDKRKATQYNDMDFWTNHGQSAYRPNITINELKEKNNFTYYRNCLVVKFSETANRVEVTVKRVDTGQEEIFLCKKLILAASTLGTARVAIRSFDYKIDKLPILCNNYCYFPCLHLGMLGKKTDERKISYSQLTLFYDKNKSGLDVATVMLYTYHSLLSFRLAKELPFGFADNAKILSQIYPSLIIAGLHHPEESSPNKYIKLVKDSSSPTGDKLLVEYKQSDEEIADDLEREKEIKKALRKLGCLPIKRVHPGYGASIHYGGTMSFSNSNDLMTISPNGQLGGTKNVFVADGSGFRYLPAKGPTFTLMANAHLVALNALRNQ